MKKLHPSRVNLRWPGRNKPGVVGARVKPDDVQRRINLLNAATSFGALMISGFAVYFSRKQTTDGLPKIDVRSIEFYRTIDSRELEPYAIGFFAPIIVSNSGGRPVTIVRLEEDRARPVRLLTDPAFSAMDDLDIELSFGEHSSNIEELYLAGRDVPRILSLPVAINAPLQPGTTKMYALRVVAKLKPGRKFENPLFLFVAKLTFSDGMEHKLRYLFGGHHPLLEGTPLVGIDSGRPIPAPAPSPESVPAHSTSTPTRLRGR